MIPTSTLLQFEWMSVSCTEAYGQVTAYRYTLTATSRPAITEVVDGTSVSIKSLVTCTEYGFQVAAVRDDGTVGPYSTAIMATTLDAGKHIYCAQNVKL